MEQDGRISFAGWNAVERLKLQKGDTQEGTILVRLNGGKGRKIRIPETSFENVQRLYNAVRVDG